MKLCGDASNPENARITALRWDSLARLLFENLLLDAEKRLSVAREKKQNDRFKKKKAEIGVKTDEKNIQTP